MEGCSVRRVENACASSGFALRDAMDGDKKRSEADIVVAGGIEKMNDLSCRTKAFLARRFWRYRMGTARRPYFPWHLCFDGTPSFP